MSRPTLEEIKARLPDEDQDAQITEATKEEIVAKGFIKAAIIGFGDTCVEVFRSSKFKKLIYILLTTLVPLEGIQIHLLSRHEMQIVMPVYQNVSQWISNIESDQTPNYSNRYFVIEHESSSHTPEQKHTALQNRTYIPITGSANLLPNVEYQIWNANSGVA